MATATNKPVSQEVLDALRSIEGAPPEETPPLLLSMEEPVEEYGPWEWAAAFGRATGRFGAEAFTLQEHGKLRWKAGSKPVVK